jgi:hypothetical protein
MKTDWLSRRSRQAIVLLMLAAFVAACSSGGTADTTSSGTSAVTLPALVGSWVSPEAVLQVTDDGSYQVLQDPAYPDLVLMVGFVARDGDQLDFVTATGRDCSGQTGVYRGRLEGDVLTLTLVDDACEMRASLFSQTFTREET